MITQSQLKEQLQYNPDTGVFTRLVNASQMKAGDVAGYKNNNGYIAVRVTGKTYKAHRLAWLYIYGIWPENHIDHINEIKDDNRFCNLREANHSENLRNRGANKNNTSGFKGVNWHKNTGKWVAKININRKRNHLGYFNDPKEAYKAYCSAANKHHGEFANVGQSKN